MADIHPSVSAALPHLELTQRLETQSAAVEQVLVSGFPHFPASQNPLVQTSNEVHAAPFESVAHLLSVQLSEAHSALDEHVDPDG